MSPAQPRRFGAHDAGRRDPLLVRAGWILGLLLAAYLTFEHYTGAQTLVCADAGPVDCAAVTSSPYAWLFGVPVALLGLLYFVAGVLFSFVAGPRLARPRQLLAGTALTGAGVIFVLYLIWGELQLGQLCLWCTGVHVIVVALFAYYLSAYLTRD